MSDTEVVHILVADESVAVSDTTGIHRTDRVVGVDKVFVGFPDDVLKEDGVAIGVVNHHHVAAGAEDVLVVERGGLVGADGGLEGVVVIVKTEGYSLGVVCTCVRSTILPDDGSIKFQL